MSCSATPKGSLMLAIATDMQTPKDLDLVSVFIESNGVAKFDYLGRVLPDGTVALPATLAVVQPSDPNAQIRIRVIGFQEQRALVLRDVLTTIPSDRAALLRLPLDFVDVGSAQGTLPAEYVPGTVSPAPVTTTPGTRVPSIVVPLDSTGPAEGSAPPSGTTSFNPLDITSRCDFSTGLTSINGQCVSAQVDSSSLPTFEPSAVFGDAGVKSNGAPASCFDVAKCFADASPVEGVSLASCSFPSSAAIDNLALVTQTTGDCLAQGQCFVPLENDPAEGWSEDGGVVQMIAGICAQLDAGAQLFAASGGGCAPEVASLPVCEPTTVATADGGVPDAAADGGVADGGAVDGGNAPDTSTAGSEGEAGAETDGGAETDATLDGTSGAAPDGAAPGDGATTAGCVPATCQTLGYTCGYASDGCGHALQCGTCQPPSICGGGGTPFACGLCPASLCSQVATCSAGAQTTASGNVYWPSGTDPVPGALVFVPTTTPAAFTDGATCATCTASGTAIASTTTATDGSFTLRGVPTGTAIPVVVQLGRWRRVFTPSITSCADNDLGALDLPSTKAEGDIPLTAISLGAGDTLECVLRKMGVSDTEFTGNTGTGRMQLFEGNGPSPPSGMTTASETALFGSASAILAYDQVILPCWGSETAKTTAELSVFTSYVNSGGSVLTTHYGYEWLYQNGPFASVANWDVNIGSEAGGTDLSATVDTSTTAGIEFTDWMQAVGAVTSTTLTLDDPRHDVDAPSPGSTSYLGAVDPTTSTSQTLLFSVGTPVGAEAGLQCGDVVFADFHASIASTSGETFPSECDSSPMTPEERAFEYMIGTLAGATCVPQTPQPSCTPLSCEAQGIQCGPAGDGCGNQIECGSCSAGQTCGGGGFAICQ
jgi:hypothetical protein